MPALVSADPVPAIVEAVRTALLSRLPHGYPTLPELARDVGIPTRTLQRRLAAAGLSYTNIVDSTRLEAALSQTRGRSIPMTDIATSLGYEDAASFTRAFSRWTGRAPSEVRRELTRRSAHEHAHHG